LVDSLDQVDSFELTACACALNPVHFVHTVHIVHSVHSPL